MKNQVAAEVTRRIIPFACVQRFRLLTSAATKIVLALLWLAGSTCLAPAQTPTSAQPNPFVQLMLAQPSIDISSPVVAEASFDPPAIRPGQKAVYRITLNAISSAIQLPDQIPAPPQLKFRMSGQGQILRSAVNALRPLTAINYEVRAGGPGMFLVPAFVVGVYGRAVVVPAAGLEVAPDVDASQAARELVIETSTTNVFLGEPLTVRVFLPATGANTVEALREVQINGDGFFVDKASVRQSIGMVPWNGKKVAAYLYETTVTPITAGALTLSAQGFTAGRDFGGPITISGQATIPGEAPQYVLLDSSPVTINSRMLPPEGELPGFSGAIGKFSCDPPQLATNKVMVGELVELFVTIRGEGNLSRLVPPEAPRVRGWQNFPGVLKGFISPTAQATNGGAVFAYTFIPLTDELRSTPAIPFSAFDPKRRAYVDLSVPAVPITVLDDGSSTNAVVWPASEPDSPPEKKPALSGLVSTQGKMVARLKPLQLQGWFVAVQIAPVFALAGLWLWDRRRRHLELHPEILRCRQARRDLRRMKRRLRRAVVAGDAAGFTDCGVSALRIACAPHYPANPRALVCADVLEVFPADERQGKPGTTVRRLFAAADASSFAVAAEAHSELLALRTELDEIILRLEARL